MTFTPIQTLPVLPDPPNTATDNKAAFIAKADAWNPAVQAWGSAFNVQVPNINEVATYINTNLPVLETVNTNIASINLVSTNITDVNTVSTNMPKVDTVSTNINDVKTCSDNMTAIIAAPYAAQRAETAAEQAEAIVGLKPSVTPVPDGTPVARSTGKIDTGWIPPVTPAAHAESHGAIGSDPITSLGPVSEKSQALGAISGTVTIDLSAGLSVSATIGGAVTLAFTGVPTGGSVVVVLRLTNGGSATVTWPTTISWANSKAPTLTAAGTDMVVLVTDDGGATWWGSAGLKYGAGA